MTTTFQLNESELDAKFMKALKSMFKNKNLTLIVESTELDETDYLLSNPANKERLLKSVKNIEAGEGLIETNLTELKAML